MRRDVFEALVGLLVLVLASAFGVFVYSHSSLRLSRASGYHVVILFSNVAGLSKGADVSISGVKVGYVAETTLDKETLRPVVRIHLDGDIKLPRDSSAKITSNGLFGQSYVAITPGGSQKFLQDGDKMIWSQGSVDLFGLLEGALFGGSKRCSDPQNRSPGV